MPPPEQAMKLDLCKDFAPFYAHATGKAVSDANEQAGIVWESGSPTGGVKLSTLKKDMGSTMIVKKRCMAASMLLGALLLTGSVQVPEAHARGSASEFATQLSADDRRQFEEYYKAWTFHQAEKDAFWDQVESKRSARRKKIRRGDLVRKSDYVTGYPPEFEGPNLSKRLAAAWAKFLAGDEKKPERPRDELPGINDYLAAAKRHYGFVPERISEREFKLRYAREALRLGLSKDQVVRVYALETGGIGTADMQAGIHPLRKTGRPISSALGYAQLLSANSVDELVKHGADFVARLERMSRSHEVSAERSQNLQKKASILRRMLKKAKSIPHVWSRHQAFAKTGHGMGIHPINLDGDIGPWLQVIKLKGIKEFAERKNRYNLDPTELELMNLAGPGTGVEMMTSVGLRMPTVNFFSRRGYERNSIVRGRTSAELLKALEDRMNHNVKNSGAVEFAEVFDMLTAEARR
ncbi:conserved protein of unknown function [Candidatus Filomicrobium marinum]|uniref:Uncharacterized protein n=3 Tax=Candidatus Filomicrobium marinum TaxID=1608628 RepID=A0A0D6JH74_9HYPH|nr:hypothetical protein [Filomicrobium sp.]CFX52804.1 conserved protein of unknown function [Candidatus Filomicrobium marinum]CPR19990.1 conserved protein of unknown function [Candidatus Filomicrobium marinum]